MEHAVDIVYLKYNSKVKSFTKSEIKYLKHKDGYYKLKIRIKKLFIYEEQLDMETKNKLEKWAKYINEK